MDRLGVGRLSPSSACPPPSEDLEPFFANLGDAGTLLMLAELEGRRNGACCCARGEFLPFGFGE